MTPTLARRADAFDRFIAARYKQHPDTIFSGLRGMLFAFFKRGWQDARKFKPRPAFEGGINQPQPDFERYLRLYFSNYTSDHRPRILEPLVKRLEEAYNSGFYGSREDITIDQDSWPEGLRTLEDLAERRRRQSVG